MMKDSHEPFGMLDLMKTLNHENYRSSHEDQDHEDQDHEDYEGHTLPFCVVIFIYFQKYGKIDLRLRPPESSRCMARYQIQNLNYRVWSILENRLNHYVVDLMICKELLALI